MQPLDGIQTGTATPSQSGPGSNGSGVLYIRQSPRTRASPSDDWGVLLLWRDAVGVFYQL